MSLPITVATTRFGPNVSTWVLTDPGQVFVSPSTKYNVYRVPRDCRYKMQNQVKFCHYKMQIYPTWIIIRYNIFRGCYLLQFNLHFVAKPTFTPPKIYHFVPPMRFAFCTELWLADKYIYIYIYKKKKSENPKPWSWVILILSVWSCLKTCQKRIVDQSSLAHAIPCLHQIFHPILQKRFQSLWLLCAGAFSSASLCHSSRPPTFIVAYQHASCIARLCKRGHIDIQPLGCFD